MRSLPLLAVALMTLSACGREPLAAMREDGISLAQRPEHDAKSVQVQHCLIASKDSLPNKATRSQDEAEMLAAEVYQKATSGEDFAALVKKHSDDSPEGLYELVTEEAKQSRDLFIMYRGNMVPAFGNVCWRLAVGEIGVAPLSQTESQYGWHIIKRLK